MSHPIRKEALALGKLAGPVAITQLGYMLTGAVDTIMLGRYGISDMNGAALGNVWMMAFQMFAMGMIFGMDPIVSQAHGARDGARCGRALQQGLVIAVGIAVPMAVAWQFAEGGLIALGQDPELAASAQRYVTANTFGLLPFLAFVVLRSYLQGRGIVRPAMWLLILANGLNVCGNWLFIYGNAGAPELGLEGSAWVTAATRTAMLIALALWTWKGGLGRGAWTGWSRQVAFDRRELGEIVRHGLPTGIQLSLELWSFQIIALMAGLLGAAQLAAHNVVVNLASMTFMVPLGIAMGAMTRVGNQIGAREPAGAQRSAWVALGMAAAVMSVFAAGFILLRHVLPTIYVTDAAVLALAASIMPIAAAFQISDGTQVAASGVLRGMGATRSAAVINAIAYYVFGLPLAWLLAFRLDFGLAGLWWGLALGLTAASVLLIGFIARFGPGRRLESHTSR